MSKSQAWKKFYVVWEGRATGVFDSWSEAEEQVKDFPGAKYRSFKSQEEAVEAFRNGYDDTLAMIKTIGEHQSKYVNYGAIPEINTNSIAVDAACSKNPGPVEYRGVDVMSGAELFRVGPLEAGTNNLGEFLAIVHGLAWLKQRGLDSMPIYSDSRTARAWVRNRAVKSTLSPSPQNAKIRELVNRALSWLNRNTYHNPILTWDTDKWGEIPADFGRKK